MQRAVLFLNEQIIDKSSGSIHQLRPITGWPRLKIFRPCAPDQAGRFLQKSPAAERRTKLTRHQAAELRISGQFPNAAFGKQVKTVAPVNVAEAIRFPA